jgi:hypothetical protein
MSAEFARLRDDLLVRARARWARTHTLHVPSGAALCLARTRP